MTYIYTVFFVASTNSANESVPSSLAAEISEQTVVSISCVTMYKQSVFVILQVGAEMDVPTSGLVPQDDLVSMYTKSKNRGNLAALLVAYLFDKETRMKSNVCGRGKEKFDPEIMKYVRHPFEY